MVSDTRLQKKKKTEKAEKNKIFISWSGSCTKEFAVGLKRVLEKTIFPEWEVDCFVSNVDIASGTDWWVTISSELKTCSLGILCISNENLYAPWIYYEAGGMASREIPTIPLLIGCDIDSLTESPLRGKQMIDFGKQVEFVKMITEINRRFGGFLPASFEEDIAVKGYKELNKDLASVISTLKALKPYLQSYSEKKHDAGIIIRNAQSDIFISTAVGNKFLAKYAEDIEEKLKAGIRVQYMLLGLDRFDEMEEYLHGSDSKPKDIHYDALKILKGWKREYPDLLSVKCFHGYMTVSCVGVDIGIGLPNFQIKDFSVLQVMFYLYRTKAKNSPIKYIFPKEDESTYKTFVESITAMWRKGEDISL